MFYNNKWNNVQNNPLVDGLFTQSFRGSRDFPPPGEDFRITDLEEQRITDSDDKRITDN